MPKILKLSLTVEIRSRLSDYRRKDRVVSEEFVRDEIYNEIRKGTLPGFLRFMSSNGGDLGKRFSEAHRYENIRRELGDAGLVFFWLNRTSITGTTVEQWGKIMNVLEEGRSWFHEEIARVFGNAAPKFLATLIGINRDVRVETNRCSPKCTRRESHLALPRAHNHVWYLGDYLSPTGSTSCLDE